jgi:type II secretory pathway pseudopilin PulG
MIELKSWKATLGVVTMLILTTVGMLVYYLNTQGSQRQKVTEVALERIGGHLDFYQKKSGRFPLSQEGLKALYPEGGIVVEDGWGHAFVYRLNEKQEAKPFTLYSVGANGRDEHGSGDDLDYWNIVRR